MNDESYSQNDVQTERLRRLLNEALSRGASDLHLKADSQIYARIHGEIIKISDDIIMHNELLTLAKELLRSRFDEFVLRKEINLTFKLSNEYRFRANIFFQKDGVSMAFRAIIAEPLSLKELNLPDNLYQIADFSRGLVLVTGSTGNGKSSTLAAIINEINKTKRKHIITIEDPIEFIYKDEMSIINQRTIGEDAVDYSSALKSALREDPDVIMVGEMRDLESIETALMAAETGHLVVSTLHTSDAKETINRIIGVFPSVEQNRIRLMLSVTLKAVVSQRLVKTIDGKRRPAIEVLFATARIQELIRQNKDSEIPDAIADGRESYGMQTFDQALLGLCYNNIISEDEAMSNATSPNNFKIALQGISLGSKDAQKKLGADFNIQLKRNEV